MAWVDFNQTQACKYYGCNLREFFGSSFCTLAINSLAISDDHTVCQ